MAANATALQVATERGHIVARGWRAIGHIPTLADLDAAEARALAEAEAECRYMHGPSAWQNVRTDAVRDAFRAAVEHERHRMVTS